MRKRVAFSGVIRLKGVFIYFFLFFSMMIFSDFLLANEIRVPDCLLGYKSGAEHYIVIVEKSTQSLYIYSNYHSEPIDTFKITTGKNHGRKLLEGDKKTPEGIYFPRRILIGEELPKTDDFGEKAFTLNYPNPIDRKEEREGSGIWLHGAFDVDKIKTPNNSRGCVVMRNKDMIKASKYIFLNKTPICIYNKINYTSVEDIQKKKERIVKSLKKWKDNWEDKNIDEYIDCYEREYRANGMNLRQYKAYKQKLNKIYQFIRVFLSDIDILAYDNYFVVSFKQLYISDKNYFFNNKIQYWMDYGNKARIVDELSLKLPPPNKFEFSKGNYISIEEFRRNCLAQMREKTRRINPYQINLKNVSILEKSIKLSIVKSAGAKKIKVIPVLRLINGEPSYYDSLKNIILKDGIPQNPSQGIVLEDHDTKIVMKKKENFAIKSLTLYLVNKQNQYDQIITYFFNP